MERIIIIGAGGVTSQFADTLCRYLTYQDVGIKNLIIVDGDKVEEANLSRQDYDPEQVGANKATALAENLSWKWPLLEVVAVPEYITPQNVDRLLPEDSLILLAVDNHASRKLVEDGIAEKQDCTLISGGNDLKTGSVHVVSVADGEYQGRTMQDLHPEIASPTDRNPHDIGCDEKFESQPQSLIMNNMIAAMMLNATMTLLEEGFVDYEEVQVDIETNSTQPVLKMKKLHKL
jgi:molybdopterin/thiamine biosynthesis adenylyltransferase